MTYTLDQMIMALIRAESREAVRAYQAGIPPSKSDTRILRAIEGHLTRAAKIDAKFTEREKAVRMGRDPAAEARAMKGADE